MYGASYYNDNGTLVPISDCMRGNNSPVFSHVGQIIHSTTLSTLAKVQEVYGADTTWIRHDGYFLRGASSGVTANHTGNDGGADSVTVSSVASHNHTQNQHRHQLPSELRWNKKGSSSNAYFSNMGSGEWNNSYVQNVGTQYDNYTTPTNVANGANYSVATLPKYKNVYIWERTA